MLSLKTSLLTLLVIGSLNVNSQEDRAKKILDDLSAKTKTYTTLKAEFSWTTEKKDKSKDTQEGKIQTKGSKYKLEIPGHDIYCDGKTVWDFIKDANEVQVKDMEASAEDAITPTSIFTIYEKGYKYKFEGEDATTQVVSLFPINPDKKKFHTIKLSIDKTKKQIVSVKVLMKDGSIQTYKIKSFLGNASLADTDFVFNSKVHPGVSVEDLR
jgi:outer membrane lipoprotein-sorting protein